jgi:hypothetical protein
VQYVKVLGSAVGWCVSLTLLVYSSADTDGMMLAWALYIAIAACMPTLWLIFDHNRNRLRDEFLQAVADEGTRTDALILAVAVEFAETELPRLPPRRLRA